VKIVKISTEGIAPQPTLDRLKRLYGAAWTLTERGSVGSINPRWWAGLFHLENAAIYCQREGFFLFDDLEGIYVPASEDSIRERIAKRFLVLARDLGIEGLEKQAKVAVLGAILLYLRGIAEVRDPFDGIKGVLALENGVLCFNQGRIRFEPFSSKFRVRDRTPVHYDPKATCPRFLEELLAPMLSNDVDLAQRHLGLIFIGQNPMQRMGIFEGDSASGKTTLVNIMVALRGDGHCCQLRTEHLDKQFELESFRGRDLLLGVDVGARFLNSIGAQTLKGLCSTDLYHPEAKNRTDRRPLRGPFNVLITTNCKLTYDSQGDGAAWARRVLIYECRGVAGRKKITDFDRILVREEGPGIVNWLLEGVDMAQREIEAHGDLVLTDEQLERINQLVMRSEAAEAFVQKCLELDPDDDVTSDELTPAFFAFCSARGWSPSSEQTFLAKAAILIGERFGRPRAKDLERNGKRSLRGWRGLRLIDDGWRST